MVEGKLRSGARTCNPRLLARAGNIARASERSDLTGVAPSDVLLLLWKHLQALESTYEACASVCPKLKHAEPKS